MFEFSRSLLSPNVCSMLQSGLSKGVLYPAIDATHTQMLKVSELHTLYVEVSGSQEPDAIPVIVLHGGPGAGAGPALRQYFDPHFYKIIMFDQRGCARSKPFGELRENTTWDLVEDMERIRQGLNIDKWMLFGGSWGSTLALTYAIKHRDRVLGIVARGIFMGRPCETEWFYGSTGARNVYPEKWDEFVSMPGLLPDGTGEYYVNEYRKLLDSPIPEISREAARRWAEWEEYCDLYRVDLSSVAATGRSQNAPAFSGIENFYFSRNFFYETPTWILDNIDAGLRNIPFVFAQARYDMDCPRRTAWDLLKKWPEAEMVTIPDANHAGADTSVVRVLVTATDWFALCLTGRIGKAVL